MSFNNIRPPFFSDYVSRNVNSFLRDEENPSQFKGYLTSEGGPTHDSTFAFSNASVLANIPWSNGLSVNTVHLSNSLTLIGFSSHTDQYPVTSNGRFGIKGIKTSHTTFAGSLAFTFYGNTAFLPIIYSYASYIKSEDIASIPIQNVPPFDINVTLVNNSGLMSSFSIMNLKIVDTSFNIDQNTATISEAFSFIASSISNPKIIRSSTRF